MEPIPVLSTFYLVKGINENSSKFETEVQMKGYLELTATRTNYRDIIVEHHDGDIDVSIAYKFEENGGCLKSISGDSYIKTPVICTKLFGVMMNRAISNHYVLISGAHASSHDYNSLKKEMFKP